MILEDAVPSDIPAVVALMNLAFRGRGKNASWNTEEAYIEGDRTSVPLLESDIARRPDASLLVVRAGEGSTGIVGSVWLEPLGRRTWYLGSLAVDPLLQKGGVGRLLLEASEDWVRGRGGKTLRMTVINVRDTLIAWYLRRGYHLTGETEPFPYDDHRFGVPTRPDLHFVVLEKALGPAD